MASFDIGFLGGGQLARMSIQAAQRLGLRCLVLDPDPDCPAAQISESIQGAINNLDFVTGVFRQCHRVTLENEFIPANVVEQSFALAGRTDTGCVLPSWQALANIQDKFVQRCLLSEAGVPGPQFYDRVSFHLAVDLPMIAKARFGGYDGKGTKTIRSESDLDEVRKLVETGAWYLEDFVPFKRELAVMVFRSGQEVGCFPTMETVQTDHVCDLVFPAGVDASGTAVRAVDAIEGFGLFGVELFELHDGSFWVNEIAPRPHNSGHATLDWGGPSQFEQHIRLVMGWHCSRATGQDVCMANLLGQTGAGDYRSGIREAISAVSDARIHWYGKRESRTGRKMGHINVPGPDCVERAKLAREAFYNGWCGQ